MRRFLSTTCKLLVTALVLAFIVWKLGWPNIAAALGQARMAWLAAGLGLFLVSCLLGVIQWQILLRNRTITIPFRQAFSLYFIGMFFNNFLFGGAAGDAMRVAYIKLGNGSGKAGLAATFFDRFAGLWAMLGFAVAGSAILLHRGLIHGLPLLTAVVSLFVTFLLFGGILFFLMSKALQGAFFSLLDKLPLPNRQFIKATVSQMLLETKDFHLMLYVAVLSTVIQAMRVLAHVCCGASLGLVSAANFQYYFIFVPIVAILMIAPLPFGVREAVGGTLFALAGFAPHSAVVMGFLASLVGIAGSLPGGVLFIRYRARSRGSKAS
jgi:uncharacterized protein (TIRG00374 family)